MHLKGGLIVDIDNLLHKRSIFEVTLIRFILLTKLVLTLNTSMRSIEKWSIFFL